MSNRNAPLLVLAVLVVGALSGCGQPAPSAEPTKTPTPVAAAPSATPTPSKTWAAPTEGTVVDEAGIAQLLPGYWTGDWGDIVFRIEDDGTVLGAYAHDQGIVVGHLEGATMVGWWCEVPSRKPPIDAGDVEMRLVEGSGGTSIDGRWTYDIATGDNWNENWDITTLSDQPPPADLSARLDVAESACVPAH